MNLQLYDEAPPEVKAETAITIADVETLRGWLPVDAQVSGGRPFIRWMDMRGVRLAEPFFQQTVERAAREGAKQLSTDIETLLRFEKIADATRPTGFIFHASRCGSTAVSNACAAVGDTRVYSEPYVVDKLLGQLFTRAVVADEFQARLWQVFLRAAVAALGQRTTGGGRGLVIKFACCSTLQLARVRRLWPEVPRVFVYREPVEIIVSNLENLPDWMRTDEQPEHTAAVVGVTPEEVARMSREEFCARALGRFYDAAAEHADSGAMLLDYEQLTPATLAAVTRFFGAAPTGEELAQIERVSRVYSKDPARRREYEDDGDAKRLRATPLVREAAERWAREPYERLRRRVNS